MMTAQNHYTQAVRDYYRLVDSMDYPKMYTLFADKVVYQRCEQTINGMAAFKVFYEKDRRIQGQHQITDIITDTSQPRVAAQGIFAGENGKGEKITLNFADFFTFDAGGLIIHRLTYLATGYANTT